MADKDTSTTTNAVTHGDDGSQPVAPLMLTTIDNPWDPFEEFDEWFAWDARAGYHTTSYLARIVKSSDELSDADQQLAINHAIEEIVEMNVLGIYQKVSKSS